MMPQQPQRKSRFKILKDLVRPPDPNKRIEDAYGIMKEVGGFRPLFNVKDVEQRRSEILKVLYNLNDLQFKITKSKDQATIKETQEKATFQAYKLAQLFNLFFASGSPWVRGIDNEFLSSKVSDYIQQYEDVGNLPDFLNMLHSESIQLIHLSWQGIDVTNTPGYIIQVINPQNQHQQLPYGYGPSQNPQTTEQQG
jgi:hypothetical protein